MPSSQPAGDAPPASDPSRTDRARALLGRRPELLAVPAVASLLSLSSLARALAAGPGGGVTLPLPAGLPTVWTYASLPTSGGVPVAGGGLGLLPGLAAFLVGTFLTGALEAGLVGTLDDLAAGRPAVFAVAVRRHAVPVTLARLLRAGLVLVVAPFVLAAPPLAVVAVPLLLAASYALYGLPFVIVVEDRRFRPALARTLRLARRGGASLRFAVAHVLAGAAVSLPVSVLIRGGLPGVLAAVAVTAPVAAFVAAYGVCLFRDLA